MSNVTGSSRRINAAFFFLAAASLVGWTANASAQEVRVSARSLADLETAFWACDHSATVHGILDPAVAIPCGIATEDLRLRKFSGDFRAMLDWWQQNKEREYRKLTALR